MRVNQFSKETGMSRTLIVKTLKKITPERHSQHVIELTAGEQQQLSKKVKTKRGYKKKGEKSIVNSSFKVASFTKKFNHQDVMHIIKMLSMTIPKGSIESPEHQQFILDEGLSSSTKGLLSMVLRVVTSKELEKLLLNIVLNEGSDKIILACKELEKYDYLKVTNNQFRISGSPTLGDI